MIFQEKKEGKKKVLIYICFETKKLDQMLIINLENLFIKVSQGFCC